MMEVIPDLTSSMTAKRMALRAAIASVLSAHEYGWNVVERFTLGAERPGASKAERDRVMGSPIRFCRIAQIGSETTVPEGMAAYGRAAQATHVFAVFIWRQYEDVAFNQSLWDAIVESDNPSAPGILPYLRSLGGLQTSASDLVYVGQPEDVITPDEPLYMGDEDYAWYLQFFIRLT